MVFENPNRRMERLRNVRRVFILGGAFVGMLSWIWAVGSVRASDIAPVHAIDGLGGEGIGQMTPLMMIVVAGLIAAALFVIVVLRVVWRIKLPTTLKWILTPVVVGAAYGLFAITVVVGMFAAGTTTDEYRDVAKSRNVVEVGEAK